MLSPGTLVLEPRSLIIFADETTTNLRMTSSHSHLQRYIVLTLASRLWRGERVYTTCTRQNAACIRIITLMNLQAQRSSFLMLSLLLPDFAQIHSYNCLMQGGSLPSASKYCEWKFHRTGNYFIHKMSWRVGGPQLVRLPPWPIFIRCLNRHHQRFSVWIPGFLEVSTVTTKVAVLTVWSDTVEKP